MPKIVEKLAEKMENAMLVKNVLDIMINEWSIEASVLTRYELLLLSYHLRPNSPGPLTDA